MTVFTVLLHQINAAVSIRDLKKIHFLNGCVYKYIFL